MSSEQPPIIIVKAGKPPVKNDTPCFNCNQLGHLSYACPYKEAKCERCGCVFKYKQSQVRNCYGMANTEYDGVKCPQEDCGKTVQVGPLG